MNAYKYIVALIAMSMAFPAAFPVRAQEKPTIVNWSAQDISGKAVSVPADRVSVLAFLRQDQAQSQEALQTLTKSFTDPKLANVLVIISGPSAADQAKALAAKCPWPVVADPDFTASGKLGVHVWPTTVLVKADGAQAGHLAGLPISYAADLQAYLDFAADKINAEALAKRLTNHEVVKDDAAQAADRHLQVAARLLENGENAKAIEQLQAGLKLQPQNAKLLLALARALILSERAKDAIDLMSQVAPDAVPGWQLSQLRGQALIALGRWDEAKQVLPDALKLNPAPADAHYFLGLVYQHDGDWRKAADEFRTALEILRKP